MRLAHDSNVAWLPAAALIAISSLSCSPDSPSDPGQTQGQIRVNVTTTGSGQPASFTVRLDGGAGRSVSPNGSVTFASLAAGNYELELVVPSNCTVSGNPTRTVGVQEALTSTVDFSVTCSAVPTGAIGITTSTSGSPIDPDGYAVVVDGAGAGAIATNGTLLVPDLPVGEHTVELTGASDNCMVQGDNPRTLDVDENQTTRTEFQVICSATTGLIRVTVGTTGPEPDPDGYDVDLDGTATQAVEANGTTTFTGVQEGSHTITLEDVAPNCTVTSENPTGVEVVAGQTSDVAFSVSCAATTGTLQVTVGTSGSEIDPNGYSVSVDGGAEQAVGVNGSVSFPGLPPGPHDVELTGVAANCAVSGSNPRSVSVVAGSTVSTQFNVTCSSTVGSIRVTATTTGEALDADGYSVTLDGTSTRTLQTNGSTTFTGVAPGSHSLQLQNVAGNCTVTSSNPVSASVTAGNTTDVSFTVECEQRTGSIQVNMSTTGSDLDPNGYTLSLDGDSGVSVSRNGTRTFSNVVIGVHTVEVGGVAANCAVQGDNPRSVTVTENTTTQVDIDVICSAVTGQIQVTVNTTGEDLDPDGYTVDLDGTSSRSLDVNDATTFTGVTEGSHTLTLQNVASNCTVASNPQMTTVTAGNTATVTFDVTCTRTTGDIRVFASSSGSPEDSNGYTVSVDGGPSQSLPINGQTLFADLQPGSHDVTISDVAPQCTVSGNTTRSVNVTADQVTDVTFTVTCDPLAGDIRVNVSTSGSELDPDGYDVLLDGGSSQPVAVNGSTTFSDVATGSHQVTLVDVAGNCTVSGSNPRSVTVVDDQTTDVNFSVTCSATTGNVEVRVTTTGEDADDAYVVTLDGGSATGVAANDTITYGMVSPGSHDVELTDVADNCSVGGANPRSTSVTAGATSLVSFSVTCTGLTGSLRVVTSTSGDDQDTGYSVAIDGGSPQAIAANDTLTFTGLADGNHDVELSGVAGNCTVGGSNPRTVSVPANDTVTTTFSVSCTSTTGNLRVTAETSGPDADTEYTVLVDGGSAMTLAAVDDTVDYVGLAVGDHEVDLSDVAGNCSVDAPGTPDSVAVASGGTTVKSFAVTCTATTGSIEVTTTTTGTGTDADGYLVDLDGGTPTAIGVNDTVTFTGVAPGLHTVTLTDVEPIVCTITSPNPMTPTVTAGATASADFSIICT